MEEAERTPPTGGGVSGAAERLRRADGEQGLASEGRPRQWGQLGRGEKDQVPMIEGTGELVRSSLVAAEVVLVVEAELQAVAESGRRPAAVLGPLPQ